MGLVNARLTIKPENTFSVFLQNIQTSENKRIFVPRRAPQTAGHRCEFGLGPIGPYRALPIRPGPYIGPYFGHYFPAKVFTSASQCPEGMELNHGTSLCAGSLCVNGNPDHAGPRFFAEEGLKDPQGLAESYGDNVDPFLPIRVQTDPRVQRA